MKWKDLKIAKKLYIGFGIVLVLLVVIGGYNYISFTNIEMHSKNAQEAFGNQAFAIASEVDHLEWLHDLSNLFLDENVKEVSVETDDHKCKLGKWLYSEESKAMAAKDPKLASILDKLKAPHKRLHSSAEQVDSNYEAFDTNIHILLTDKWVDHLNWIKDVANSIMSKTVFDGGIDPYKCAFGKWYYAYTADNPTFGKLLKEWEEPHANLHKYAAKLVAFEKAGNWKKAEKIYNDKILTTLASLNDSYLKTAEWVQAVGDRQKKAHDIFEGETKVAVSETQEALKELTDYFSELSKHAGSETNSLIESSVSMMFIITFIAIIIGLGSAWWITRGITNPLSKVVNATEVMNNEFEKVGNVLEAISNNDLSMKLHESEIEKIGLDSKDEIGMLVHSIEHALDVKHMISQSTIKMSRNLNTIIRQLSENATQLASAATEVASAAEQTSRGAQTQEEQISQITVAMEEMTATIVESSRNTSDASSGSKTAADTAGDGGQIVSETIEGMNRIAQVVRESSDSIGKLASSAEQIGEIISVIDDIADQTNLLALNAAIEAARAGEQGRGFAVVADEVRKLAERTGKATGEITDMIKGIQQGTADAVASMEAGTQEVNAGRELADKAGNSLSAVVDGSEKVMDMIQQIATATEQQSVAAEEISKNIEQVASVTKESAAGADQASAAAEELSRNAEGLQQIVGRFKVAHDSIDRTHQVEEVK